MAREYKKISERELETRVFKIMPGASLETDNFGQIVIYTGLFHMGGCWITDDPSYGEHNYNDDDDDESDDEEGEEEEGVPLAPSNP